MSNASNKRRMAELAKARAFTHDDARPSTVTVSGVVIKRTGKMINKRVGWIKNGEPGGCTMRVREVACAVKTRQVSVTPTVTVELVSRIGLRPHYNWTGPALRSGDAPCGA
jgi:hypothetical protein